LLSLALLLYFNKKRPSRLRTSLARYTNSINLKLQPRLGLQIRAALSPAALYSSPPETSSSTHCRCSIIIEDDSHAGSAFNLGSWK